MDFPFTEQKENDYYIRIFSEDVPEDELVWHRDRENRIIEPIGKTDWLFQHDNEVPIKIDEKIFIPKETYHRIIKGTGELKIKLFKIKKGE